MPRKINWSKIKPAVFKTFVKLRSYEQIDLHFQLWNMILFWITKKSSTFWNDNMQLRIFLFFPNKSTLLGLKKMWKLFQSSWLYLFLYKTFLEITLVSYSSSVPFQQCTHLPMEVMCARNQCIMLNPQRISL